ncbi:MAG: PAS domain-containing sensor histidine kinase [Gemmatimonadaceae bacterium]
MATDTRPASDLQIVFPGSSVMAAECRSFPWETTSLGPPSEWAPALRTAVAIVLESPFPMNLWSGPDLNLIYNDGYRAVLGAKHPQALGRPGREVWSEIWPEIRGLFDQIRAGGPPTYAEDAFFLMERTSGPPGEAWFTFSLSPVRDEDGRVVAFLNVAAETTERVLAERAMIDARAAAERAEGRLRSVFAQAPAFVAVLRGKNHVFEFANDAYMSLVGNRDIIGKPVAEALPEVRHQGFIELLDNVYETGAPYVGRETAVALARSPEQPPEEVYLDFVYQPLIDGAGARVGIVAHGSNVTEAVKARREVERLLHASEQARADSEASEARYRFLANSIPVQVWTATPEGALDYVSDRTAASLGRTPEEVVGEGWLNVLHPDDVAPTIERWTQSLKTGDPYEVEFRLWDAGRKAYRWHLGRASAQRDEKGRIIRWFGTNTDIEESKRTEEDLRRLTDEALEANRAKSDFLAAMSHDLRTPLNAIGGYAQLIEMGVRGPITDAQKADLERIQRSKSHLDRLVSDVLSFAKLGAGRIELRCEAIKLKPLLGSVVDMIRPQLAEKKLNLAPLAVDPELRITADLDKTQQILVNLLANALKFTPPGGTIALGVAPGDADIAISVSDTGIGIPEEDLERIFEPFAQAKRALVESDAGVGLGLAISRQLARAMGGDLKVTSAVGRGSTFTLTVPRAQLKHD